MPFGGSLERHLLLLARVRCVVGRDAVDGAVAQRRDQCLAVAFGSERRAHAQVRVERPHVVVRQQEVVRRRLGAHVDAERAREPHLVDRLGHVQVTEMDRLALVACDAQVARDHHGLADRRVAADPEHGRHGALVHRGAARQRRDPRSAARARDP